MLLTMLALFVGGQPASPPAAPRPKSPSTTMQQRFDAASEASANGRCADAIREFEALEASGVRAKSALLAAAIDVRKGGCFVTVGRKADGVAAIRRGLPVLVAKGSDFAGDVREAHMSLGYAAQSIFDYTNAIEDYRTAADLSEGVARIVPLMRLSQAAMFDHDGKALAAAQEARTLALAAPGFDRKNIAAVQTQYARVLLNEGRKEEAYKELKNSLSKQGGLDNRVGVSDIATRSDLAIAALQNKDLDGARLYLAYTGAGRVPGGAFAKAAMMEPPACGGEAKLSSEDEAIVEFTLEEDGRVSGVSPIYVTGGRTAAIAFARAVTDWSWKAEDAGKIPLLFRYTTRVEMRCIKTPEPPGVVASLADATEAWIAARKPDPAPWTDLSAAAALPLQRAALARARAARDAVGSLESALALAANPVVSADEGSPLLTVAANAAADLSAPAPVHTYIALGLLNSDAKNDAEAYLKALRALLASDVVASDPLSAAVLRLAIASPRFKSKPPADAGSLLDAVIADPALPKNHPVKIAATLQQANVLAAGGDLAGARAVFDRTGLTSEQCALVGLQPAMRRSGASSADYPLAALRLGFEGWVRAEYDIAPDGRTIAPRVVTAYPPFVFDDAATGIIRQSRYTSTFRPEGALACSGKTQSVVFSMP